jgi:protein-S-isoprenylcysteine O-methyltransferase Ste14
MKTTQPQPISANTALIKSSLAILLTNLFIAIVLFGSAGRVDWKLGWLFVVLWGLLIIIFMLLLRWHDPALLVERAHRHESTQSYDRWIVPLYFVFAFCTIFLAGFNGRCFHWSGQISPYLIIAAYIVYLLGNGLASWAASVNPFFSSESRLQPDRNQHVTQMGPYRFMRHPAYSATVIIWPVTGLLLESWYAIIPGLLASFMMFIRTVYEHRMLQSGFPGYIDYASHVRYRLIPSIW